MHLERHVLHLWVGQCIWLHRLAITARQRDTLWMPYEICKDLQTSSSVDSSQTEVDDVLPNYHLNCSQ